MTIASSSSLKRIRLLISLPFAFCLSTISFVECSSNANNAAGSGGGIYGGRHSYSLSTFSPSGDLDQVARAMRASTLGAPIVALSITADASPRGTFAPATAMDGGATFVSETTTTTTAQASKTMIPKTNSPPPPPSGTLLPSRGGIYLSIPLRFLATSPFLIDDGTPRIVQITSSLCVAHTGVGADGRALCDVAVKLALDYRYVYGEEISPEELLEGLAEKVQEMTMRAGSRPFGCALLVGCLGSDVGCENKGPTMYRVDPSGAVVLLNSSNERDGSNSSLEKIADHETTPEDVGRRASVAFLGNWDPLRQMKDSIRSDLESQQFATEDELQRTLIDVSRQTCVDESPMSEESHLQSTGKKLNQPILFASFTHERGLQVSRTMERI